MRTFRVDLDPDPVRVLALRDPALVAEAADGLDVDDHRDAVLVGVVAALGVADAGGHLHVPLLVSPYGYSTYRGS